MTDLSDLCLPQTVEIAVLIGGYGLVAFGDDKLSHRSLIRLQIYLLIALLGLKNDPLDIVDILHGMGHAADGDSDLIAVHLNFGDVLFNCAVAGAGDKLAHLLAAADYGDTLVLHEMDYITAMIAYIKLHIIILHI